MLQVDTGWHSALAWSLKFSLLLAAGNLALVASARLTVPFWPVPMTMETFAVLAIGVIYNRSLALATIGAFLLEGLLGLPVFTHGGGLAYLLGPTGGYLLGYGLAVAMLAEFKERGWYNTRRGMVLALLAADAGIFALGFAWLTVLIGPEKAWSAGVVPFLLGDALKVALVAASVGIVNRGLAYLQDLIS
jgi:biotin transport system substrate-specific component